MFLLSNPFLWNWYNLLDLRLPDFEVEAYL